MLNFTQKRLNACLPPSWKMTSTQAPSANTKRAEPRSPRRFVEAQSLDSFPAQGRRA